MSRARSYVYTTAPTPPPTTSCYYYDDMEGYVGDYSESEGLSDGAAHMVAPAPPDVTEIYRRKTVPAAMPPPPPPPPTQQVDYHHAVYTPREYYYDPGAPQATIPRRTTVAYRKRVPAANERTSRYYSPDSGELYESVAFRSTHQMMPAVARNLPSRVPSATAVRQTSVRRHPITVRTPRFYRRPGSTTLYKRPSALCLPVACQPDPAFYKRSKRSSSDQIYPPEYVHQQQATAKVSYAMEREKSKNTAGTQKISQQPIADYNDLNVTRSKLDAALQRYEQIFEKNGAADGERYPEVKIAQMLKPKVPQAIKEKHEPERQIHQKNQQMEGQTEENRKIKNKKNQKIDFSNARILEVEGAESDALEKILLADLKANGLAGNIDSDNGTSKLEKRNRSPLRFETKVEKSPRSADAKTDISIKDLPKSFNYQDIQNVVVKAKQHQQIREAQMKSELKQYSCNEENAPSSKKSSRTNVVQAEPPMSDTTYSRPTSAQESSHVSSKRLQSQEALDKSVETKAVRAGVVPRVLVDDALELHRTKSYVVNLIDHALSNHFGTNLCEKYSTKDNPIDPRVAMELLKKHSTCKVVNKDICLEIAQALADSFNTSPITCPAESTPAESKQESNTSTCSCNKDEPLYVKQLKQLRWGHLKHIQREIRRLEDLERFLDSCTSTNIFQ